MLFQGIQETVLRLVRTADQLIHSAHYDAEGVRQRLRKIDEKCEDFMLRLDTRRKNLALAISFFLLAQSVSIFSCYVNIQRKETIEKFPNEKSLNHKKNQLNSVKKVDICTVINASCKGRKYVNRN